MNRITVGRWGMFYGRWWALQYTFDGWLSFGIHADFRHRPHAVAGSYGPYLDLHLGALIFSVGNNPAFSGELEKMLPASRGGL